MVIEELMELDGLRAGNINGRPLYVHDDHRWTLVLLASAQERELVPRPCDLFVFDRHSDSIPPFKLDVLRGVRAEGSPSARVLDVCRDTLSKSDGDWIVAGMELGLIGDVVVFGAEDRNGSEPTLDYTDGAEASHRTHFLELPGRALGHQGSLSDMSRSENLHDLWRTLGWSVGPKGFSFTPSTAPRFLSIDLDCFVTKYRERYLLPWPEEVYAGEFLARPDCQTTATWTGKDFLRGLLVSAGVVDIAREPDYCGGPEKADRILSDVNRFLFDGCLVCDGSEPRASDADRATERA